MKNNDKIISIKNKIEHDEEILRETGNRYNDRNLKHKSHNPTQQQVSSLSIGSYC